MNFQTPLREITSEAGLPIVRGDERLAHAFVAQKLSAMGLSVSITNDKHRVSYCFADTKQWLTALGNTEVKSMLGNHTRYLGCTQTHYTALTPS